MGSAESRNSAWLYIGSLALIGIGIIGLRIAEQFAKEGNQPESTFPASISGEESQASQNSITIARKYKNIIIVISIILLLIISPIVVTLIATGETFDAFISEFGGFLLNVDGYGSGISDLSIGVSLSFALAFGVGWASVSTLAPSDSRGEALVTSILATISGFVACIISAVTVYLSADPETIAELQTLLRLGIAPGQLLQTIFVLSSAGLVNFWIEFLLKKLYD